MTNYSHADVVVDSIDALRSVLDQQGHLPSDWMMWFQSSQVVLTGIGKSFNVACLGASLLQTVGCPAQAVHATDLLHGGFGIFAAGSTATLVVLSHSGRTREIIDVVDHVRTLQVHGRIIRVVAITTLSSDNVLATRTQHLLRYATRADGSRHGTIPSVSTTAQLAWLNVIACEEANRQSVDTLALGHPAGNLATVYGEKIGNE